MPPCPLGDPGAGDHWRPVEIVEIEEERVRDPGPRFDIVFTPAAHPTPTVLRSAVNADDATLVFAAEAQRLQARQARGELAIRRRHDGQTLVLRQPMPAC